MKKIQEPNPKIQRNFRLGHWQRSFVTGLLLEFPLLLWRRGLGRGGRFFRDFSVTLPGAFARVGLLCALGFGLWPQSSPAQTNALATNSTGNRYLFILETSRSMHRRSAGVL